MSEEIRVLGQVCKALREIQYATWSRRQKTWSEDLDIDRGTRNTYTELINSWSPLTENDMESLFPVNSKAVNFNLSEKRKALYLSPTSNQPQFVPVLSLECSMNNTEINIKIRIMLIQKINDALKGVGFRFEKGEGTHNYYHVQLIKELQGAKYVSNPVIEYLEWLPESEPAIPIKAKDPVTLLLCSLISLYGLKTCSKLITEHQISELKKYLNYFVESNEKPKSGKKK